MPLQFRNEAACRPIYGMCIEAGQHGSWLHGHVQPPTRATALGRDALLVMLASFTNVWSLNSPCSSTELVCVCVCGVCVCVCGAQGDRRGGTELHHRWTTRISESWQIFLLFLDAAGTFELQETQARPKLGSGHRRPKAFANKPRRMQANTSRCPQERNCKLAILDSLTLTNNPPHFFPRHLRLWRGRVLLLRARAFRDVSSC